MDKLQEIKSMIENQMIFLEGYTEDIHFENEVHWLIKRIETLQQIYKADIQYYMKENERLRNKNNRLVKELQSKANLD